jgi:GNAT superfamily N-acetyltransferase
MGLCGRVFKARLIRLEHPSVMCEEGGHAVALIEPAPTPSHLLIENLAVLPDRHGGGIGGLLLECADEIARSVGLNELRSYTDAKFVTNIAFYAHRGFEKFPRESHPAVARCT